MKKCIVLFTFFVLSLLLAVLTQGHDRSDNDGLVTAKNDVENLDDKLNRD